MNKEKVEFEAKEQKGLKSSKIEKYILLFLVFVTFVLTAIGLYKLILFLLENLTDDYIIEDQKEGLFQINNLILIIVVLLVLIILNMYILMRKTKKKIKIDKEEQTKCLGCKKEYSVFENECPHCHFKTNIELTCPKCHVCNNIGRKSCINCGEKFTNESIDKAIKSTNVNTLIISLFLCFIIARGFLTVTDLINFEIIHTISRVLYLCFFIGTLLYVKKKMDKNNEIKKLLIEKNLIVVKNKKLSIRRESVSILFFYEKKFFYAFLI